ncbi:MAG: hypothetical protein JWR58_2734 [Pseudonocardia sp.]|nr:hypothetical protein [Pseudonocardia sp.]
MPTVESRQSPSPRICCGARNPVIFPFVTVGETALGPGQGWVASSAVVVARRRSSGHPPVGSTEIGEPCPRLYLWAGAAVVRRGRASTVACHPAASTAGRPQLCQRPVRISRVRPAAMTLSVAVRADAEPLPGKHGRSSAPSTGRRGRSSSRPPLYVGLASWPQAGSGCGWAVGQSDMGADVVAVGCTGHGVHESGESGVGRCGEARGTSNEGEGVDRPSSRDFTGKVVIVTGAGSGIGRAAR